MLTAELFIIVQMWEKPTGFTFSHTVYIQTIKYCTEMKYNHMDPSHKHTEWKHPDTKNIDTTCVTSKNKKSSSMMS